MKALMVFASSVLLGAVSVHAQANDARGVVLANMDRSVKPGDNFYQYANGGWMKRTQIPADRSAVGGFSRVLDRTNQQVASIIEDAGKAHAATGSEQQLIADLYQSFMDTAAIEHAGLKPLKKQLEEIGAIQTQQDLARVLGSTLRADTDALNNTNFHTSHLFGLWVAPDFNDSEHYTAYLMQGGIAMRDREYYVSDSAHMQQIRTRYKAHMAAMFRLAGFDDAEARAQRVFALEMAIAKTHLSLAENEDIHKANNPWAMADFARKAPGLDWSEYFRAAGLSGQRSFIVWQPSAITGEAALVASTPIATWQDWLRFHLIEEYGAVLPKSIADEWFDFNGKTLSGVAQPRPREQRAIALVNRDLGDAVGRVYAERFFSAQEKQKVQALVANLIAIYHQRLEANTWMAPATKAEAIQKLDALQVSVGYPDRWRSYAGLEIRRDDLAGNVLRAGLFDYHYELSRIGKPVDRKEWCMDPQTVNAVNLPLDNGLNFPAAILQAPFYEPDAPDAFNYGAIGSVIGHEISHTFDAEGAAFDAKGQVRNWWTPEDFAHFEKATAALAAQYDGYMPFPDLHVNGKQTVDENIADVAGLSDAFAAYHASLHGKTAPVVEGLTGDQQFFLAFGQNWAEKEREAALRAQVVNDAHSPAEFRADTVRNIDGWYAAFDVKPGQKLYLSPEERVKIY